MNNDTVLIIILILFCLLLFYRIKRKREGYLTTTYTSTPEKIGVTTTNLSSFNYYPQNTSYSLYPDYSNLRTDNIYSYTLPGFIGSAIKDEPQHFSHYSVLPNISEQYKKPMFTSVVDQKDLVQGRWVQSGIAYTDDEILNVYQYSWDPAREIYEYRVKDKDGFIIPIENNHLLEDKDTLTIPQKGGKTFTYQEYKYNYAYV